MYSSTIMSIPLYTIIFYYIQFIYNLYINNCNHSFIIFIIYILTIIYLILFIINLKCCNNKQY